MLAISPGPDNIFVLLQSALHGYRTGFLIVLGLCTGLLFHTFIVTVGIAGLIAASDIAFTLLKLLGAAYLLYLAWGACGAKPVKMAPGAKDTTAAPPVLPARHFHEHEHPQGQPVLPGFPAPVHQSGNGFNQISADFAKRSFHLVRIYGVLRHCDIFRLLWPAPEKIRPGANNPEPFYRAGLCRAGRQTGIQY